MISNQMVLVIKMRVLMMVIEHVINCSVPFCDSDDDQISAVCKTE